MTLNGANRFIDVEEGTYNGLYSVNKLDINPELLSLTKDGEEEKEIFKKLLEPVMTVVYVLIFFGVLLGMIAVTVVTNMVVEENAAKVSMLKVLGYRTPEISRMLLSVNKWFAVTGYLLSLPLSYIICKMAFIKDIGTYNMYIETVITPIDIILGLILVLSAYFVTLIYGKRKLGKINLVESLKDNRDN